MLTGIEDGEDSCWGCGAEGGVSCSSVPGAALRTTVARSVSSRTGLRGTRHCARARAWWDSRHCRELWAGAQHLRKDNRRAEIYIKEDEEDKEEEVD